MKLRKIFRILILTLLAFVVVTGWFMGNRPAVSQELIEDESTTLYLPGRDLPFGL